ncbi:MULTISPECIES: VOC family protein [Streptomyces]|uniref:VOC family protein n=1 Tax=Streptomyces TaxID=1883 RepID=UPI0013027943|nr:VOC family protein [Streptomyces murinus]
MPLWFSWDGQAGWTQLSGSTHSSSTRRENDLGLGFQQISGPKVGKNRMHVDVSSADPAAEQRCIERLRGRRLNEYTDGGFLVMADPEGNEFCVIPEGPFELDDEGRADYLS